MKESDLDRYTRLLQRLRVDHNKNRYTTGKAPHKATLLLSLIILSANKRQDLANIKIDLDLKETWVELWKCLDYEKPGPIHLPLYHLISSDFWNIDLKEGISPHPPSSLDQLQKMVLKISMKDDLIGYIADESSRDKIISSILNGGYYSEDEKKRLIEKIEVLNGSFIYESEMIQAVKKEFTLEARAENINQLPLRDSAFRRMILGTYKETCAICGMQVQTTTGISVIDAAHILPFNKFHNDDIRNGIALCKIHHWLFDRGLISVDDHYRVIVSKSIEMEYPDNIITGFHKLDIRLPQKPDHYPHPVAIKWHRTNVFER